jgi:hypothetical protein
LENKCFELGPVTTGKKIFNEELLIWKKKFVRGSGKSLLRILLFVLVKTTCSREK